MDESLRLLTGPVAGDLLAAAVASAGGDVLQWRPKQVDHRPGRATTVSYAAVVRWAGAAQQQETLAASAGNWDPQRPPPGTVVVSDGNHRVAVWRFPVDPALPALPVANDPVALRALLAAAGAEVAGDDLTLRVRSYRPRRRSVIEVRGAHDLHLFVKVVRPQKVAELRQRHEMLHDAGLPVPAVIATSQEGLVVMTAREGNTLRSAMRSTATVPEPGALFDLLDALPAEVMALPRRRSWTDNAAHYAAVVGGALNEERDRARQLADAIGVALRGCEPDAPTHGDFYEGQILVSAGGGITGLLDVDTLGPGRRADDAACLIAHGEVLALAAPQPDRIRGLAARWLAEADHRVDPQELRWRVAGVLLSLATGPYRVQEQAWQAATHRRLDAVEAWVRIAQDARLAVARG